MSSKAAYKVHKVFPLQAFVATFKSLVVFVSKKNIRFFVFYYKTKAVIIS